MWHIYIYVICILIQIRIFEIFYHVYLHCIRKSFMYIVKILYAFCIYVKSVFVYIYIPSIKEHAYLLMCLFGWGFICLLIVWYRYLNNIYIYICTIQLYLCPIYFNIHYIHLYLYVNTT